MSEFAFSSKKIKDTQKGFDRINYPSDAVSINANRIYDSCADKDCLSDLRVFFTEENQVVIEDAISVRLRCVEVLNVLVDLDPVQYNRGYYSIDATFFFEVILDVLLEPGCAPVTVSGLSVFNKKCMLYGSDGSVKVFSTENDVHEPPRRTLPKATVQVAAPVALEAHLKEHHHKNKCCPPCQMPNGVVSHFGGCVIEPRCKTVFITVGLFSIIQIERNVQMMIPSYDFSMPNKECDTRAVKSPCDLFSQLDFPTCEFFPPEVMENDNCFIPASCDCGCK